MHVSVVTLWESGGVLLDLYEALFWLGSMSFLSNAQSWLSCCSVVTLAVRVLLPGWGGGRHLSVVCRALPQTYLGS